MKIFGKRPFVLKTGEMDGKIKAIVYNIPDNYGYLFTEVEDKLREFSANADFFKKIQEAASNAKKLLKKNKNRNLEKLDLSDLLEFFKDSSLDEATIKELKYYIKKELIAYFKTYTSPSINEASYDDFVKNVEELEKECREVKQKFKDDFEKVSKLLKSCIKKLEKQNIPEGIKQALSPEIIAFRDYKIYLDKIMRETEEAEEKIRSKGEDTSWEIIGSKESKGEDDDEKDEL